MRASATTAIIEHRAEKRGPVFRINDATENRRAINGIARALREPARGGVVERQERSRMKLDLEFTSDGALQMQSGAYALIADGEDRVLLVRAANGRFYLPGGRIEPSESPQRALAREVEEECGWSVRVTGPLGEAFQPIMDGSVL